MLSNNPTIILSRTDSIGDVVLTLPMAGLIKKYYPQARIIFIGRSYTKSVIALSEHVDLFLNYDSIETASLSEQVLTLKDLHADCIVHVFPQKHLAWLAKKAEIPLRVGTTNRVYHWFTCNKRIPLSRRNSDLHESQLNIQLLSFLSIPSLALTDVANYYGFTRLPEITSESAALIDTTRYKVILHPKSKGSAKEWGLANFEKLIQALPSHQYKIYISGTEADKVQMNDFLQNNKSVVDLTGKLSLPQFIAFIGRCDALVAASTGPLHIAAALGKNAIGLFSPKRPIHPGRWMPVGKNAHYLVFDENCKTCKQGKDCNCIQQISAQQVVNLLK